MSEQWKPILGYEGFYEVSDLGRVRNIKSRRGTYIGKIHKARPYGGSKRKMPPYWAVALHKNGVSKNFNVARLVAVAFIGPRPEGCEINHIDANKANNAATNLEYVTPTENKRKAWADGTYWHKGISNRLSKLTEEQVLRIWEVRNDGYDEAEVARYYGVSAVTLGNIWRKRSYRDLLIGDPRDGRTKLNRWSKRKQFLG